MTFENVKISILYGSQTGNAQDVAERLWRESKRFYFQSSVKSLDEYNARDIIQERCAIFVCSTTGQGDEPDNMRSFWRFLLRRSLPSTLLSGMKLHKRLLQLGGQSLQPLGQGDDQHDLGYDAIVDPWIASLWTRLLEEYPLPSNVNPLPENLPIVARWSVTKAGKLLQPDTVNQSQSLFYSTRRCDEFDATILENGRQTDSSHFQDVRLIRIKTEGQEYIPGDLVVLRPKNLSWKILEFKNVLGDNGVNIPDDTLIKVLENDQNIPLPEVLKSEVTFKQLCEEYFDLFSIPRRSVFQVFSQLTDSDLEKEKCLEFCSAEGQQDMYAYTNRPRRNIVEVLGDFPHATKHLTLEMMFEIIPMIKPREFSVASSFRHHISEVHLLVAVVKYKTNLKKERVGLCSNFLADLKPDDKVSVWLKHGSFKFPLNLNVPVIMIGPGTGVAPFRSYIFEMCDQVESPTDLILFYGCRYSTKDFLCKEEFVSLANDGKLSLFCAFSREQEKKVYVQDKIVENGKVVWEALSKNCYVFVAGNSKNMPQQVKQAFIDVCMKHGGLSETEAVNQIEQMEKQKRYQTECWS